ncbi:MULTISPECIES: dehydrogenase [Prochlorococcus]|uniref:Predicted dehydrogenase n=1 Tax=Prochlorococcus marinus (strain SARG / CCMP1375 / SS120) TaxID=167539 RepID=Q7V9T6_PROMA|nr:MULTISPECIES: dehydrogenase [Prochlorococcus]AAQ00782.1 Predicted dehydrogenase [Prochlorococcus marinus subsp. marinus str. CCMP1375]KGG10724.1 putative N-acetylmuramoyl-L-alanine amidase [Prochlorococcus marinus str. LG]KGG21146.1 putative N-acetylmuramoyl-L-alanine amidase [Prochlorococcus marinus str. SS2]KGG23969.1 putative N-acetylmuramoyl-L-alanine amidase [Prochlorococcus marinus str. SS35]KGG31770.1 putative N-acetylmuramoyl-L-alanine amidase [Prochlorococcus marinus str. SS51]
MGLTPALFAKVLRLNFWSVVFLTLHASCIPLFLSAENLDSFLGQRIQKNARWVGNQVVSPSISILILAGHADSQGIEGAGTVGEAVGINGSKPMDPEISDELFWNFKIQDAVVKVGKDNGLTIDSYSPSIRTIVDENDFQTNWSVGSRHAAKGGYVIEIHFDSYGKHGFGSGLIPPLSKNINNIDEALAQSFGRYPIFFRGGLGGPRRQIRILEIGKLEGDLEKKLRDLDSRDKTIEKIANLIVQGILDGVMKTGPFNPLRDEDDIFLPDSHL